MGATTATHCTNCDAPTASDHAYCTKCGARLVGAGKPDERCTACGVQLEPDAAFCTACGAPQSSGAARGLPAVPAGGLTSTLSMVGMVAGGGAALPWQTVAAGQPVDVKGLLRLAAPLLAARAPRPNLRRPALAIAFTLLMTVVITAVSGGPLNVPMFALRLIMGVGTAALGFAAGGKGGALRKVTGLASVAFGIVQLVALVVALSQAGGASTGALLLLSNLVAVVAGLVLAVSTAIKALRS